MKMEAVNPETGEKYEAEAPGLTSEILSAIADLDFSDERVKKIIDGLDVSADVKSIIFSISKITIRVGNKIIKIGRKIIDIATDCFSKFPTAGFGAILGAILGLLVGSIPVFGIIFGPLITPLTIGLGMVVGAAMDISDQRMQRHINNTVSQFAAFREA